MVIKNSEGNDEIHPNISRRTLLKESLALAVLSSASRTLLGSVGGGVSQKIFAYVGTYSDPGPSGGNGKGIYLFEMNPATGDLTLIKLAAELRNPSWLSLDPSGRFLFATNDIGDFAGHSGAVTAFAVNRINGNLQLLNTLSSEGEGPAHLSVDAQGRYVFVANYAGGSIAVLPILPTGVLGPATYSHKDGGSVGPTVPSSAPQGSFAFSGHDAPHAHMIQADPGNRFVLQTDLGQDRIYVFSFDYATGKLIPLAEAPFVSLPPGDGPRHFVFHRNGRWLYSLQEEASTVVFFHFDPTTGSLRPQQTISTLPQGFRGTSFTSEVLLSPDGRFLYAANRLHDTIAVFSLDGQGRLHYMGETSTMGDYPRHIQLAPGGAFMYACNQRSDSITLFSVDQKNGLLTFSGRYIPVGSPSCITFLV
jgi:6-phosphogluconolactonase